MQGLRLGGVHSVNGSHYHFPALVRFDLMPKPAKIPVLLQLPASQREELCTWLMEEKVTYDEARKRLAKEFNVKAGNAALSVFWARVCEPRKWARERRAEAEAKEGRLLLNISVRVGANNTLEITVGGPAAEQVSQVVKKL